KEALHSDLPNVRIAAVDALYQLSGPSAVPELLQLLPSNDGETSRAIQQVLFTADTGQLPQLVLDALAANQQPETQVLLLEVLAHRGAGAGMPAVLEQINGSAPAGVKTAAYRALPQIARPEDLSTLLELLQHAGGEQQPFVQ